MNIDPLVDANRHMQRQGEYDRLFWQAYRMLHEDFLKALIEGPQSMVATPHDVADAAPIHECVQEHMECENVPSILCQLLGLATGLAFATRGGEELQRDARILIENMADHHAAYYVSKMSEAGDLQP